MEPTNQLPWIIFELKDQLYAISTEMVTGISQLPSITVVPNAPPMFIGVTSARGSVVPTLDLKKLLNIGDGKEETEAAKKLLARKEEGMVEYIKEIERCMRENDELCITNHEELLGGRFRASLRNGKSEISKMIAELEVQEQEMTEKVNSAGSDTVKLRDAHGSAKSFLKIISDTESKINDDSYRMVIFLSDVPGSVIPCLCFVVDNVRAVDQLEMIEEKSGNKCLFMSGYVCGVAHNEKIKGEILIADDKEIVKMVHVYNKSVEKNKDAEKNK